jgi:hypothetical protein
VTDATPPPFRDSNIRPRWRDSIGFWDYLDRWGHYAHVPRLIQLRLCNIADYWNDSNGQRTDRTSFKRARREFKRARRD